MRAAIDNVPTIVKELNKYGIVNKTLVNAILATIAKETNLKPIRELSYRNTAVSRLRFLFGDRLANYTDDFINNIKKNDIEFYDLVYGYKTNVGRSLGNVNVGDGYAYRGGGFNQLTFKNQFKKIGDQIGVDLLTYPQKITNLDTAAAANAVYFINSFKRNKSAIVKKYGIDPLNIQPGADPLTILKIAVNANAGWGANKQVVEWAYGEALPHFDYFQGKRSGFIPLLIPLALLTLAYITFKR